MSERIETQSQFDRAQEAARFQVEDFNSRYGVGTRVTVRRDNGDDMETVTRSEAWVVGSRPVVQLEGIAGCYDLTRVSVLEGL